MNLRLHSLLHPACRSCNEPVRHAEHLCQGCIDRMPVERRWAYREAYDGRRRDREAYRFVLARAIAWLSANPRPDAATQTTTVKEPK